MKINVLGFALLFAFLAGLSSIIGGFLAFSFKKESDTLIPSVLGFTVGLLGAIVLMDMLPESFEALTEITSAGFGIFLMITFVIVGILLGFALEKMVHKNCHEKGHHHLFKTSLMTTIGISLHKFPEGMAIFMATMTNVMLGLSVTVAIALHHVLEGVSIAVPLYQATKDKKKTIQYLFFSGLVEPVGALFAFLIIKPFFNQMLLGVIYSIISGTMIFLLVHEIIPSMKEYKRKRSLLFIAIGFLLFLGLHFVIHE